MSLVDPSPPEGPREPFFGPGLWPWLIHVVVTFASAFAVRFWT